MNLTTNKKNYNLELNSQEIKLIFEGLTNHAIHLESKKPEGRKDSKKQIVLDKMIDQINMELEGKPYYSPDTKTNLT